MTGKNLDSYTMFKIFGLFRDRLLPTVNEYRKDKDNKKLYNHIFLAPETYSKRRAFQVKGASTPFVCLWAVSPLTYNKQFYARSVLPEYFDYVDCKKCEECTKDENGDSCPGRLISKGFLYDYEKKFELSASSYFADFRASVVQDLLDFDRLRYFDINVDELLPGYSCKVELLLENLVQTDNVDQTSNNRSFDLGAKYNLKITLPVLYESDLYENKLKIYMMSQVDWMKEATEVDFSKPPEPPVESEPCTHIYEWVAHGEEGHSKVCSLCQDDLIPLTPHDFGDNLECCKDCDYANPNYTPPPIADVLVFNKNAYFDIPYYANNNTRVVVDCEIQYSDLSNISIMFGSRASTYSEPLNTFLFASQVNSTDDRMRTDYGLSSNIFINRDYLPYNTRGIVDKNKNKTFINEVEVASNNAGAPFTSPNIFRIGNFIGSSFSVNYGFKGKIYSFKIYDNDNLVHDLVPIAGGQTINGQTATQTGFYDHVSNVIFYSVTGVDPGVEYK